jgi:sugar/nucleoside kinase (ribokinase family)
MELTAAGVQLAGWVVPGGATGTIASLVEPGGQRSVLADRGADLALPPDDVPPPFPGGHLHLSGHTLLGPGPRTVGLAALAARLAAERRTGPAAALDSGLARAADVVRRPGAR